MAEHAHDDKKDAAAPAGTSMSVSEFLKIFGYILLFFTVVIVSIFFVFLNQEAVNNFIYFLYGIEILFGIYIFYLLYSLRYYYKKFMHHNHDLMHFYSTRYVPPKENTQNATQIQMRFARSKEHIMSKYREEWKIGIIELDTILKDLLKERYKVGDTVGELLKLAGEKGMASVNLAWEAHKVRNMIVHEGVKYDMSNDTAMQALRKYTTAFRELGLESYTPKVESTEKEEKDSHVHH